MPTEIKTFCNTCIHKEVCKYKCDIQAVSKRLDYSMPDSMLKDDQITFEVKANCRFYKEELTVRRDR